MWGCCGMLVPMEVLVPSAMPTFATAALHQTGDQIAISAKDLGWALVPPRQAFRLRME